MGFIEFRGKPAHNTYFKNIKKKLIKNIFLFFQAIFNVFFCTNMAFFFKT